MEYVTLNTVRILDTQFIIQFITAAIDSIAAFHAINDNRGRRLPGMAPCIPDHKLQILFCIATK